MKKFLFLVLLLAAAGANIQAATHWPSNYGGVMLQGFYWDSYNDTQWTKLESQAEELASYFSLIWVPQSGNSNSDYNNMGYMPYYYWDQNSSFGTESQLRSMISTFKTYGLGTVADVVVNHHNTDGWFDFPEETYNGNTYQFLSTDICADDDGGATATEAAKEGVSLSSNNDEGEDWSGCRDLDHKSENVQKIVKAYVKYLKEDLGYTGFRYDMVKGFDGSHVGEYNDEAGVEFSVGEYWDSNSAIETWIKNSGYRSAAFDFQFRYNVRDAINAGDWTKLNSTNNLMHDADYRQYAVTFLENHDTEYRSASEVQDPIYADTLAANAYLLSMPGTPCVFLKHWLAYKQEIKGMIDLRKAAGITNMSDYSRYSSGSGYYAVKVSGDNCDMIVMLGTGGTVYASNYVKVAEGYHYAYYLDKTKNNMVWADRASGTYEDPFDVLLSLVSDDTSAQIVYTLDGSEPTASNGTKMTAGGYVTISSDCTLKAGLLSGGTVSNVITREYSFYDEFEPYDITVYVNADDAGSAWSAAYSTAASPYINFWTWNDDTGAHSPSNTSWPGDKVTDTTEVDGTAWFYRKYTMEDRNDYVSFVFSVGTGTPQTVDVAVVTETKYYKVSSSLSGSKYKVDDVTSEVDGIGVVTAGTAPAAPEGVYTLDGRRVAASSDMSRLGRGVYVTGGKKMVVK